MTMLTRNEVAQRLGVTYGRVRTLERNSQLRGSRGADGIWRFDAAQLEGLRPLGPPPRIIRARTDGEVAARAFELFSEGKSTRDVVIALRETPDKVAALRASFAAPEGVIVEGPTRKRIERALSSVARDCSWGERFADHVDELVAAERKLCAILIESRQPERGLTRLADDHEPRVAPGERPTGRRSVRRARQGALPTK